MVQQEKDNKTILIEEIGEYVPASVTYDFKGNVFKIILYVTLY